MRETEGAPSASRLPRRPPGDRGPGPHRSRSDVYARLEILRQELQELEKAIEEITRRLQVGLSDQARREYLSALSPYFRSRESSEPAQDPAALEEQRQLIHQALETVRQQIPLLEGEIGSGPPPAGPSDPGPSLRDLQQKKMPAAGAPADQPKKRLRGFESF